MCVVSFVSDQFNPGGIPWTQPKPQEVYPDVWPQIEPLIPETPSEPEDLDLKEILAFIKAIGIAREYDVANGEEDCPDPLKMKFIDQLITNLFKAIKEAADAGNTEDIEEMTNLIETLKTIKGYI